MGSSKGASNTDSNNFSMAHLHFPQRAEAWDRKEDGIWRRNGLERQDSVASRWQKNRDSTLSHIRDLDDRRRQLIQEEDRLKKELVAVRMEAANVITAHDQETRRLGLLDAERAAERPDLLRRKENIEFLELIEERPANKRCQQMQELPRLASLNLPRHPPEDNRIVAITDTKGTILHQLRHLRLSNERTAAISAFPVHRPVQVVDDKCFFTQFITKIYDCANGKGAGWLACIIQATGTVQAKKCRCCEVNEAPFESCIIIGDALFPKCGNCEWNCQICHGLDPIQANDSAAHNHEASYLAPLQIREPPITKTSSRLTSPSLESSGRALPLLATQALAAADEEACVRASQVSSSGPQMSSRFKAMDIPPRIEPRSPRINGLASLPSASSNNTTGSCEGSNTGRSPVSQNMIPLTAQSMDCAVDTNEITQDNLILRHDGYVYIYPECIEGVPLMKISPSHPYWEKYWPDLKEVIQPTLDSWIKKRDEAEEAHHRGEKVSSVSRWRYARQVNRGNTILEFLETGAISPYQLLSKQFMGTGKGSITSPDTLYRLCETINELKSYKLDIEPVEWLRQRLHELFEAQGTGFNFPKTIRDFYHDPKLTALRIKSRVKSTGRPSSGRKSARRSSSDAPFPPRKRMKPTICGTLTQVVDSADPSGSDKENQASKSRKTAATVIDTLATGEISDTDSWSGAPIEDLDFRVYQVKTRRFTSSDHVTQYWHWVDQKKMFEHQVLKDINPATWAVYRKPIDFSLRMDDVVKIDWNLRALRANLVMSDRQICREDGKPRGDVMVAFKRPNTMRRFIRFCASKETELVEGNCQKIDHLWAAMDSQRLLGGEEKPSTRLGQ